MRGEAEWAGLGPGAKAAARVVDAIASLGLRFDEWCVLGQVVCSGPFLVTARRVSASAKHTPPRRGFAVVGHDLPDRASGARVKGGRDVAVAHDLPRRNPVNHREYELGESSIGNSHG